MALVGILLPLASCSSASSSALLGNAPPPSSATGVVGSNVSSLNKLSVAAMSVVPTCHRPSSLLFVRVAAAAEEERLGGGLSSGRRIQQQLGRCSIAAFQRRNYGLGKERRRKWGANDVCANYGIKEYGAQVPLHHQVKKSSPKVKPSTGGQGGGGEVRKFWDYGAPTASRPYTSPKYYGAPKNYGIPAYSAQTARVAAVEAVQPPQGMVLAVINSEPSEQEPELGGSDQGPGKDGGGGGGGGDGSGGGEESKPEKPMSTSQKLTLVYAALVGVGGLVGFAKSGSIKSLMAGGGAALALFLVFTQLPTHPTFASSVGLGISGVLLGIMFPRFQKSGKFMPAGLVSLVSLIMTGGYLHGIVRTAH